MEANDAQDAALDAALSLLWQLTNEIERQEPQAVTELFGAVIHSVPQPA